MTNMSLLQEFSKVLIATGIAVKGNMVEWQSGNHYHQLAKASG